MDGFVAANPTNQSTDPMPLFSLPSTANQGGRFTHVACTASGLEFGLLGQAAELVNVTMLVPSALSSDSRAPGRPHASPDLHRVKVKTFTLDANGKSSFAS